MRRTMLVSGIMLSLISPLAAQEQQRPGRGFGAGFAAGAGQVMLLSQKSVQEELKLSEEQVKKIQDATAKQREAFQGLRNLSAEERRQKFQELAKENEKNTKEILAILNPEQTKRLKQISTQQRGVQALNDPEVATAVGLTDEQKEKLKAIQEDGRKAMRELTQGGNREGLREKFQELRKANEAKVQELLTSEQKAKWKELTGEPFKGELAPFGGRQPRRGA